MLATATAWLEKHAIAINALNVFPVPDGDTGTNMLLTMRAALEEIGNTSQNSLGAVAQAAAYGALMGARGNSGVILSQLLRGIANSLDKKQAFGPLEFALAMDEASTMAYKGIIRPVEGTMLTVSKDAAKAAMAAAQEGGDLITVLEKTVEAAKESVARTPTLLDVLREAGVVDAGGQGLFIILDGILRNLKGESIEMEEPTEMVPAELPEETEREWGYCIEHNTILGTFTFDSAPSHGWFLDCLIRSNIVGGPSAISFPYAFTVSHNDFVGGLELVAPAGDVYANISEDPEFCGAASGDYTVHEGSPCDGAAHDGLAIGAFGVGCDVPVDPTSWGAIKARFR
jgi:hypothetical protein